MPAKPPAAEKTPPSFESALERLETIVGQMESDQLPLEELIARFEEGSKLVKVCQERLETAEKRIEIITRGASGKPQVTEFEPAMAAPSMAAPAATAEPDDDEVSLF